MQASCTPPFKIQSFKILRHPLNRELASNISINVDANLSKHFMKRLCPLSNRYTKYFRKVLRNLPCNDSGNICATFLVIFRKIFLECCGNIGLKIFWPRYEYFEKFFTKVSARFRLTLHVCRELAWNISIDVNANFLQDFVKFLCPLSNPKIEYFRNFSETFRVMIAGMFTRLFL